MLAWVWLILVIFVGVLISRRFGRLLSFAVMVELIQVAIVIFAAYRGITTSFAAPNGSPLDLLVFLIPGFGFLPGIGRYSGLSVGGLVLWLILIGFFALVAMFSRHEPLV